MICYLQQASILYNLIDFFKIFCYNIIMKKVKVKIKDVATTLMTLEKECQLGNNVPENMKKMEQLTSNLSLEDMLKIDEYISQNFLTK